MLAEMLRDAMLGHLLEDGGYGPSSMPVRVVGWDELEDGSGPYVTVYYRTADHGGGFRTYRMTFDTLVRRLAGLESGSGFDPYAMLRAGA